jgi:peroxiredoxin
MDAWGKSVGVGDKVLMLADGNGQFAKALGVELDLADKGLGLRSRRYALLADDQVRESVAQRGVLGPPFASAQAAFAAVLAVIIMRMIVLCPTQVVKVLNLEEGGAFTVSSADTILEALG